MLKLPYSMKMKKYSYYLGMNQKTKSNNNTASKTFPYYGNDRRMLAA